MKMSWLVFESVCQRMPCVKQRIAVLPFESWAHIYSAVSSFSETAPAMGGMDFSSLTASALASLFREHELS